MVDTATKRQAEQDARAEALAKRNDKPASSDLSALLGGTDPAHEEAAQAAPEAGEGPIAEAIRKTAPATRKPPPWAKAHPKVKIDFTTRFPEELHLQLTWLKEHMPNTSIQKIVHRAVKREVEQLIRENYK